VPPATFIAEQFAFVPPLIPLHDHVQVEPASVNEVNVPDAHLSELKSMFEVEGYP